MLIDSLKTIVWAPIAFFSAVLVLLAPTFPTMIIIAVLHDGEMLWWAVFVGLGHSTFLEYARKKEH